MGVSAQRPTQSGGGFEAVGGAAQRPSQSGDRFEAVGVSAQRPTQPRGGFEAVGVPGVCPLGSCISGATLLLVPLSVASTEWAQVVCPDDMFTLERHLSTPGQGRHSPRQRHTAAGTAAPATTDTGNPVSQRANPTQTAYAHPQRGAQAPEPAEEEEIGTSRDTEGGSHITKDTAGEIGITADLTEGKAWPGELAGGSSTSRDSTGGKGCPSVDTARAISASRDTEGGFRITRDTAGEIGITADLTEGKGCPSVDTAGAIGALRDIKGGDREDASSMVTAGATANTTVKNSRASRESGFLCSHSHGESIGGSRVCGDTAGEICVAGSVVAAGYFNDPQLSEERFVTDAFGRRWFRTGDLGRVEGGVLFFAGRADSQVTYIYIYIHIYICTILCINMYIHMCTCIHIYV